jgi:hypothetical protein
MTDRTYTFRIDKEGVWYHEGVEITHERTYYYLNTLLQSYKNYIYYIEAEGNKWYAEVEDTPFVVVVVKVNPDNKGLSIRLNDGTEEVLCPESLTIGKDNIPYCQVKGGRFEARFNRPSYYSLAQSLQYDPARDQFFLESDNKQNYLGKRE